MPDSNIKELAENIGLEPGKLQEILGKADIKVADTVSREDKSKLLMYLREKRGSDEPEEPTRVVLSRRSFQELRGVTNAQGSNRQKMRTHQIGVEMRKTRVYIKRGHIQHEDPAANVDESQQVQNDMDTAVTSDAPATTDATMQVQDTVPPVAEPAVPEAASVAAVPADTAMEQEPVQQTVAPVGETAPAKVDAAGSAGGQVADSAGTSASDAVAATTAATAPSQEHMVDAEIQKMQAEQQQVRLAADAAKEKPDGNASDSNRKRKQQQKRELHIADDMSGRRRKKKGLRNVAAATSTQHSFRKPSAPVVREVVVPEHITVQDLAQRMAIKSGDLIKLLMNLGTMVTINHSVDQETAVAVVEEMGHKARLVRDDELESEVAAEQDESDVEAVERAPVVTVMGHVDHGKTTLLDRIRSSEVAAAEAGGITQHIGAYTVETADGKMVTFLDTPGHEAFSTMRARGASVTDVAVIVVAADDGVKPQTAEAVKHAKSAAVPMVVAVTKCDKEGSDAGRIRQQMAELEVNPEEWGGDTIFVDVSAKTGAGIDSLLESILLQTEILELRAPAEGMARGIVLEAHMDKSLGAVATVLVQQGRLNKGDYLLSGVEYGRIRQLRDENGKSVNDAGPSKPVLVTGLSGTPEAGDTAMAVANERRARDLALQRRRSFREKELAAKSKVDLGAAMSQMGGETVDADRMTIVLKADVQGTVEALRSALEQCSTDKVKVEIISSGVGSITASDVNLAIAGNSFLAGFNVRADSQARKVLREENVEPRYYNVIYDMVDDVKAMAKDMLKPEIREQIVGLAEVRNVFRASKVGEVAGCVVVEGMVKRGLPIRVLRDNVVVYEGELESLRHFKEDVQEVKSGTECGIGVKNYKNIAIGDQIEVFERQQVKVE